MNLRRLSVACARLSLALLLCASSASQADPEDGCYWVAGHWVCD